MKKFSLILILAFISKSFYSQDLKTIVKRDTSKPFIIGGYGEPFVGMTQLNNSLGLMIGFKGGRSLFRDSGFSIKS